MPTLALTVAYNGAPFSGFARQPDVPTVQGEIERALELVYRLPCHTTCAGRTDAGVHARAQVVSFDIAADVRDQHPDASVLRSVNAITHPAIAVKGIRQMRDGFSARFDACSREYRYFISCESAPPLFMRDFSWHVPHALDVEAMHAAAQHLVGEHDFKSFCLASSAEGKPTRRTLYRIDVERTSVLDDPFVCITVAGSSFLHSMVRTIVGTLVAVGKGLRQPDWVASVLAACDRQAAGEKAPAQGLVFWSVDYEPPQHEA